MHTVTHSFLKSCYQNCENDPLRLLACNAATHHDITEVIMNRNAFNAISHQFSLTVPKEGPATNQQKSGRCWLFAALNTLRLPLMKKYNLETFEFSQSFCFFWDQLEKCHAFLSYIIKTLDLNLSDPVVRWLLDYPLGDGGQWHMFTNIVNKYGLVPKSAMPESFQSSNSAHMNYILTAKLREFACQLRETTNRKKIPQLKTDMMQIIFRILSVLIGMPPKTFNWEFRDNKKKFHSYKNLTPHEFVQKHVPYDCENKVCLIHAPTKDKPYNKLYTVQFLGNIIEGTPIVYFNISMKEIKAYTIKSLKEGEAVWFGCDVGKNFHRVHGIMDLDLYNYQLAFGTSLGMTKAQRLDYHHSKMTHAMVITGVDLKEGLPQRWRIENSWGDQMADKGYFVMTDAWFEEYVYEVVVDTKYLSAAHKKVLTQKPHVLPPWDPMGSLA